MALSRESNVLRPIITVCPVVSCLNRIRSSGMCHGNFPFFANNTIWRADAAMIMSFTLIHFPFDFAFVDGL